MSAIETKNFKISYSGINDFIKIEHLDGTPLVNLKELVEDNIKESIKNIDFLSLNVANQVKNDLELPLSSYESILKTPFNFTNY